MAGEQMSFEEAFGKLEETVEALERGDLSIEETVALYEQGMKLARLCQGCLDAAELRINQLVVQDTGEYEIAPFNGER
ncbi:MAG: exodeoxyribonuclease VII small subunit [Chloroflexi bacterium]|nr:exodeoxyribonuclease VII small subunit [Chloroflexota bacterium]